MIAFGLGLLVLIHAGLAGFRSGAGRNPRLFLENYYQRCVLRGLFLGGAQILVFGLLAFVAGPDWMEAAQRMFFVVSRFAFVGVLALSLYALNVTEWTILATTLMLGPLNLVRPLVVLSAGVYAAWGAHPVTAWLALAAAVSTMAHKRLLELGTPPWTDALATLEADPKL